MSRHYKALAVLAASLLPYGVVLLGVPASGDQDAAIHALFSRWPLEAQGEAHLYRLLSVWARPLFALAYAVPGQLGYTAMRVWTVGVCGAMGWGTYLLASRLQLPRPWLVVPCTLLQPVLLGVGADTMTEPIFALVLAWGLVLLEGGHRAWAAVLFSLLPLARPEGAVVLGVLGLWWGREVLRDRRAWGPLLLLGLGLALWELACWVLTGNWRYLLDTFPWALQGPQRAATGPLHYVLRWPLIVGLPLLVAWGQGLRPAWQAGGTQRLCLLLVGAVLGVHTLLYATGGMSSTGFDRYFATVAPANGLLMLVGLARLAERQPTPWPVRRLRLLLGLQALQGLVWFDLQPQTAQSLAALRSLREARARVDLSGRKVLASDLFVYVFLDADPEHMGTRLPAQREQAMERIERLPAGTVVLWEDRVGLWWYGLTVEDFSSRGYRLLWEQQGRLATPWLRVPQFRPFRQAVLVRE